MKKNFIISALALFVVAGCAMANGMVFDPTAYTPPTQVKSTTPATTPTAQLQANKNITSNIQKQSNLAQDALSEQSTNFNNALFELDSAQVNLRNELLEYKAKYQEIDTQYQLIKEQRKVLDKQVKAVEKRIKEIDTAKEKIRKNML